VGGALAALDAGALAELDVGGGRDASLLSAPEELDRPDVLHVLADLHAASAANALVGVENEGARRCVDRTAPYFLGERLLADAELGGEALELALLVARAGQAVVRVGGEDKFDDRLPRRYQLGVVGDDIHALVHRRAACADQFRALAVLYDANSASRPRLEIVVYAEGGDLHLDLARGYEDRGALGHLDWNAVYLRVDHIA